MGNWLVPFAGRNHSGAYNQNFLWQEGNVYIMDNHRAAYWCWMQHVQKDDPVCLMHVDRHFDTITANMAKWLSVCPDVPACSIEDYLNASYIDSDYGASVGLFRWDNYLSIFLEQYGSQIEKAYFATHQEGERPSHAGCYHVQPWELVENLEYWLNSESAPFILNIDLDYFFCTDKNEQNIRFLDRNYFNEVFETVGKLLHGNRIKAFTLCLSPECCDNGGSWNNAEALCAEATKILGLDFRLPK